MQTIRTIVWMMVSALLVAFIAMNWNPVRINVWPDTQDVEGFAHFNWPVGIIALLFFFAGLLPTWLLAKLAGWRLRRRIGTLEDAVRSVTATPFTPPQAAPDDEDPPASAPSQP